MSASDHQTLRVLEGRYVLERLEPDAQATVGGEVLAVVRGPDGGACMRRQDADDDGWIALWNGDEAHPPDATGARYCSCRSFRRAGRNSWRRRRACA